MDRIVRRFQVFSPTFLTVQRLFLLCGLLTAMPDLPMLKGDEPKGFDKEFGGVMAQLVDAASVDFDECHFPLR